MEYKVLLVASLVKSNYSLSPYYHKLPTLGIGYIAGFLKKNGFTKVSILDKGFPSNQVDELVREVLFHMPQVVGFYTLSENYKFVVSALEKIKVVLPNIISIIGGPHVYGFPKESVSPWVIDFGIWGEAEETFYMLLNGDFNPLTFESIPGLIYKANGLIKVNEMALVKHLDEIPFPARHLYPPLKSYRPSIVTYRKLPATGLITSRGCSSKCTFCHSGKGHFGLRFHSPEYVIEEMTQLKNEFGMKELFIFDDTFVANPARAQKICEMMVSKNLDLSWSCNARVNNLTKELLKDMKRAGCWLLQVGVESGNQGILNSMRKGISLAQVREACDLAHKMGFQIKAFFIIGNAAETRETLRETIDFMLSLPIHYVSVNFLTPLPGTQFWDEAEKFGTFDRKLLERVNYLSDRPMFIPHGLNETFLTINFRKAYLKFYLRPMTIWRNLSSMNRLEDLSRGFEAVKLLASLARNHIQQALWKK